MRFLDRLQAMSLLQDLPMPPQGRNSALRRVGASADLERIKALPVRQLNIEDVAPAKKWTQILRHKHVPPKCDCLQRYGQSCIKSLLTIQGIVLEEAYRNNGAIAFAGVGAGKFGITILLPMILPGIKKAVLFIPKPMMHQCIKIDYPRWARHWHVPTLAGHVPPKEGWPILHVIPYSMFSSQKATHMLDQIQPDLVVADEAHNIGNACGRTSRVKAHIRRYPRTLFVPLSGSFQEDGMINYYHLADMALREGSPVPRHLAVVKQWDSAFAKDYSRGAVYMPGALEELAAPGETPLQGFSRRLHSTPGVVISAGEILSIPLRCRFRELEIPQRIKDLLKQTQKTYTRPDGEELLPSTRLEDEMSEAFTVSAVLRQLHSGFYTRWKWIHGETPEMIQKWKTARKEWRRELREQLQTPRQGLDTPGLLEKAAYRWYHGWQEGETQYPPFKRHPLTWDSSFYPAWKEVSKTVTPVTETIWVDSFVVQDAIKWGKQNVGIIWYASPALGEAIARAGDFPLYGRGEQASLEILTEDGSRTIVASLVAHGEGKNLQRFSKALVTQVPSSHKRWEQLLGRLHRRGQQASEVVYDIYAYGMLTRAFEKAEARAELARESLKVNFRLLFAKKGR